MCKINLLVSSYMTLVLCSLVLFMYITVYIGNGRVNRTHSSQHKHVPM